MAGAVIVPAIFVSTKIKQQMRARITTTAAVKIVSVAANRMVHYVPKSQRVTIKRKTFNDLFKN